MSALQKADDDELRLRDIRIREILATARANLAGHGERNERWARELATARANIAGLHPKRPASVRVLAPTREQDVVARLRQERVARTLREARANVATLADMPAPSRRPAQRVYKTKTDARRPKSVQPSSASSVAREAPSQDEATNYNEVFREAIAEVIAEMFNQERARWQREFDSLQRQVGSVVRELDIVHRQLRQSP